MMRIESATIVTSMFIVIIIIITFNIYNSFQEEYKIVNIGVVDKENKVDISADCVIDFLEAKNYTIYKKFKVKKGEIKKIKVFENKSYHFYCWSDEYYLTKVTDIYVGVKDNLNLLIELEKIGEVGFNVEKFKLNNDYILNITTYSPGKFRKLALCSNNIIPYENQNLVYVNSPDRLSNYNCYYTQTSLFNNFLQYQFTHSNNFTLCAIDSVRFYNSITKQWQFGYEDLKNNNIGGQDYCMNVNENN